MSDQPSAAEPLDPEVRSLRKTLVRWGVIGVVCALAGYTILDLVDRVDWQEAFDAVTHVTWWQVLLLFGALVVRQTLNASPLALFLPGLSLYRATLSDQAATLVSMVAPPPTDMVLRIKILNSWEIDPARGLAGATMNVLAFYANRLLVPLLGFVILLFVDPEPVSIPYVLVTFGAGVTLVVGLRLSVRDEGMAERIALFVGGNAAKVRRTVNPRAWAEKLLDFRGHIVDRFAFAFPRGMACLFVMTLLDASILLMALRCVGVPATALSAAVVLGGFLLWYPLTITPFAGIGLLDAALVTMYTRIAGEAWESEILAGMMVYRVITLGGPMVLGALALWLWRRTLNAQGAGEADGPV